MSEEHAQAQEDCIKNECLRGYDILHHSSTWVLDIYSVENTEQKENMHSSCSQEVYSQLENAVNDRNNYQRNRIVEGPEGRQKIMEINREKETAPCGA